METSQTTPTDERTGAALKRGSGLYFFLWILSIAVLVVVFRDSLLRMTIDWQREEYSHGFLIPLVAIFLVWQRLNALPREPQVGSWLGFSMLLLGLIFFLLGELSALYALIQYAFLLSLTGVTWALFGTGSMRIMWAPFCYLTFMIPLPNFLYANLSNQLQLISSQLGVAVIRLFDISVHLEGNVIDLGPMQLQVAEACSGLRYLFPLLSFGFLVGYLYRGRIWHRAAIFLSAIPITILMNSFRIGVIGITVDRWGIKMAEGFLHDFEGWIVFMCAIGVLFIEIAAFQYFGKNKRPVLDVLDLHVPKLSIKLSDFRFGRESVMPFWAGVAAIALTAPYFFALNERPEIAPSRTVFAQFPLIENSWRGRTEALDNQIVDALQFSDYFIADYARGAESAPVNLYMAWYASQKKGASIHSPRSCIPGGGWRIDDLQQRNLGGVLRTDGSALRVNRAIIRKGDSATLVYYWFEGRGRNITNEYMAKWYIFWDSLTRSRSDGALVRVVTPISEATSTEAADLRLEEFLKEFYPLIPAYVP